MVIKKATDQNRTGDLVITNDALYRLSYSSLLPFSQGTIRKYHKSQINAMINFKYFKLFRRSVFLICACFMLTFMLSACDAEIRIASPMSERTLLTLDSESGTVAEAVFRLMEVKEDYRADEDSMFWDRAIGDITFEDYIKD